MLVDEFTTISVVDVHWDVVRIALGGDNGNLGVIPGFVNFPGACESRWQELVKAALRAAEMDERLAPFAILQSTKPMPPAWRSVKTSKRGTDLPHIIDPMGGRWNVLTPGSFKEAVWHGSDGGEITVERLIGGWYTITCTEPLIDRELAHNYYGDTVRDAVSVTTHLEKHADRVSGILRDRDNHWSQLFSPVLSDLASDGELPTFQDWAPNPDGVLPVASEKEVIHLAQKMAAIGWTVSTNYPKELAGAHWSRNGVPVYAATIVPPKGWDRGYIDALAGLGAPAPMENEIAVLPLKQPEPARMPEATYVYE